MTVLYRISDGAWSWNILPLATLKLPLSPRRMRLLELVHEAHHLIMPTLQDCFMRLILVVFNLFEQRRHNIHTVSLRVNNASYLGVPCSRTLWAALISLRTNILLVVHFRRERLSLIHWVLHIDYWRLSLRSVIALGAIIEQPSLLARKTRLTASRARNCTRCYGVNRKKCTSRATVVLVNE